MPYRVRVSRSVRQAIRDWHLSDTVFTHVQMLLDRHRLGTNPASQLIPARDVEGGMLLVFSLVDPDNRFREHSFLFRVFYDQDEETLWVVEASHLQTDI